LRLTGGAVLRTNETTQRVTTLDGTAGTQVEIAAGGAFTAENGTFAGTISGAGRFTKESEGTLTLTDAAASHTTGDFVNNAGTTRFAGALSATGIVNTAVFEAAEVEITAGGEVENSGALIVGELIGNLENSGNAQLESLITSSGGSVANTGNLAATMIAGKVENRGMLATDFVSGDVSNYASGQITPRTTAELTIDGDLKNDGTIWFDNESQRLRVKNISNATAGGVGRYSLTLDFNNPANARIELAADGSLSGKHEFVFRDVANSAAATRATRIELVSGGSIASGAQISVASASGKGVDGGAWNFAPETPESTTLVAVGYSALSQAAVSTAAMLAPAWFAQVDSLAKRLGELRISGNSSKLPQPSQGGAWVRTNAQQVNADLGIDDMPAFRAHQYGADVGGDLVLSGGIDRVLIAGVFAGYQSNRLQFRGANVARGETDTLAFGAYTTWINTSGWHIDALAKGQLYESEYRGAHNTRGKFDSTALGVGLEIGKRVEPLGGAWFAEATVRVDYTHLLANDYELEHGQSATRIRTKEADILRFSQSIKTGRVFDLGEGRFVEPAIHIGIEEQVSSGGKVSIQDEASFRPHTDGIRCVVGAGIAYQLTPSQQVHFDFESSFGDKYDRPWSFNLGYRVRF
jgi:outer membrane autotransporter protein